MDSMSSGAIADSGLVSVNEDRFSSLTAPSRRLETPEFTHGTPSMTYSGCALPAFIEFTPRIWTRMPAPGAASPWVTCTPATRPSNPCSRLATAVLRRSCAETDATAPVRSARRCVPYPTTTTSDRVTAIGWIAKFSVTISPAVTARLSSRAEKPMRLARTRCVPAGTAASTKPPSSAVTAARSVPTTLSRTATTGRPVTESATCPVMVPVPVCAPKGAAPHTSPISPSATARRVMACALRDGEHSLSSVRRARHARSPPRPVRPRGGVGRGDIPSRACRTPSFPTSPCSIIP